VRIVIATAEPRGAYHIEPMYEEMRRSSAVFYHLVPYPEAVQGRPWENTVSDLEILATADRVVLTGGGYTPWTELVAHRAESMGIPIVVSELASGSSPDARIYPQPLAVSAMSPAGARLFAEYYCKDVENVFITGIPLLDTIPVWKPEPKRALLLSTAGAEERDPSNSLRRVAENLQTLGWRVVVRPHPRESLEQWLGFELDRSSSPAIAAANALVAVGYPGSAHAVVAALGVPVVALAPNFEMRSALPVEQRSAIANWIYHPNELDIENLRVASAEAINQVCGPVGGAAERVVRFWCAEYPIKTSLQ